MTLSRRRFLQAVSSAAVFAPYSVPAASRRGRIAHTSDAQRMRAIRRGLGYIERLTKVPRNFAEYGADFLWCFYSLGTTAKDPWLRDNALRIGRERAAVWRRRNPSVPPDADADDIADLVFGWQGADALGVPDASMARLLRAAAAKFSAVDYLKFDPAAGRIPANVPADCETCSAGKRDGSACTPCTVPPTMTSPYELLLDALITTWSGEHYGVRLGADFADVTALIPTLRPYRGAEQGKNDGFIDIAYAVTHIVYVFNDYGKYRLRPEWLPQEYAYLRENFEHVIEIDDPETMGEFIDTLKSFGMTGQDPLIRRGMDFIMSRQHADGSWGDPDPGDRDPYTPYHATWTAINGLMDYARGEERVSFPEALRRANQEN